MKLILNDKQIIDIFAVLTFSAYLEYLVDINLGNIWLKSLVTVKYKCYHYRDSSSRMNQNYRYKLTILLWWRQSWHVTDSRMIERQYYSEWVSMSTAIEHGRRTAGANHRFGTDSESRQDDRRICANSYREMIFRTRRWTSGVHSGCTTLQSLTKLMEFAKLAEKR
jgi:hypothetical protein